MFQRSRIFIGSALLFFCLGSATLVAQCAGLMDLRWLSAEESMPRVLSEQDVNGNGISDTEDLISGARLYVRTHPIYVNAYHRGGYPPPGQGVCSDVIWNALRHAGRDFKRLVDEDIRAHRRAYTSAASGDSNIDFRRVANLRVYFKRHWQVLDIRFEPGNKENMAAWQPGDIVTFQGPDHIAVLSDKRNRRGVPLLLHNDGPVASEGDAFEKWAGRGITGHFRLPGR